jgi:hypothetical protein
MSEQTKKFFSPSLWSALRSYISHSLNDYCLTIMQTFTYLLYRTLIIVITIHFLTFHSHSITYNKHTWLLFRMDLTNLLTDLISQSIDKLINDSGSMKWIIKEKKCYHLWTRKPPIGYEPKIQYSAIGKILMHSARICEPDATDYDHIKLALALEDLIHHQ